LAPAQRVEGSQVCEIPVNEIEEISEYDSFGPSNQSTLLIGDISESGENVAPGYFFDGVIKLYRLAMDV